MWIPYTDQSANTDQKIQRDLYLVWDMSLMFNLDISHCISGVKTEDYGAQKMIIR